MTDNHTCRCWKQTSSGLEPFAVKIAKDCAGAPVDHNNSLLLTEVEALELVLGVPGMAQLEAHGVSQAGLQYIIMQYVHALVSTLTFKLLKLWNSSLSVHAQVGVRDDLD